MIPGKILLFISLVFFIILLLAFFLSNPSTKASNDIRYPYILSIKPAVLQTGGTADITFWYSDPVRLLVINPEASQFSATPAHNSHISYFPDNFGGSATTSLEGNYTVLMVSDKNNQILASVNFNILRNPQLASFIDFIFGKGLGFTIGFIVPIIPVIYQFASQQKEDHLRRLEDQAEWVRKSYRYVIDLSASSLALQSIFESKDDNTFHYEGADKYDPYEILYNIIQYNKSIRDFYKHVRYLYFQDFWLENFLYNLSDSIYHTTPINMKTLKKFEKFFNYTAVEELKLDKDTEPYVKPIKQWLGNENEVKDFYLNHLANRLILYVEGTRKSIIMSPDPHKQKHAIDMIMSQYKDELEQHIHNLNIYYYHNNTEAYYELYDQRNHKILSVFNRYIHYKDAIA